MHTRICNTVHTLQHIVTRYTALQHNSRLYQHIRAHCNTLHHIATHCGTLQHTTVLQQTAPLRHTISSQWVTVCRRCSVLQCVALCCNVSVRCSVMQCAVKCRSVLQCVTEHFLSTPLNRSSICILTNSFPLPPLCLARQPYHANPRTRPPTQVGCVCLCVLVSVSMCLCVCAYFCVYVFVCPCVCMSV